MQGKQHLLIPCRPVSKAVFIKESNMATKYSIAYIGASLGRSDPCREMSFVVRLFLLLKNTGMFDIDMASFCYDGLSYKRIMSIMNAYGNPNFSVSWKAITFLQDAIAQGRVPMAFIDMAWNDAFFQVDGGALSDWQGYARMLMSDLPKYAPGTELFQISITPPPVCAFGGNTYTLANTPWAEFDAWLRSEYGQENVITLDYALIISSLTELGIVPTLDGAHMAKNVPKIASALLQNSMQTLPAFQFPLWENMTLTLGSAISTATDPTSLANKQLALQSLRSLGFAL
jgi:hypothetical protein